MTINMEFMLLIMLLVWVNHVFNAPHKPMKHHYYLSQGVFPCVKQTQLPGLLLK